MRASISIGLTQSLMGAHGNGKLDPATLNPLLLLEPYSGGRSIVTLDGSSHVSNVSAVSPTTISAAQSSAGSRPGYGGAQGLTSIGFDFLALSAQIQLTGDFTIIAINSHGSGNDSVLLGGDQSIASQRSGVLIDSQDNPNVFDDGASQASFSSTVIGGGSADIYSFRRASGAQNNYVAFRSTQHVEVLSDSKVDQTVTLNSVGVYSQGGGTFLYFDDTVTALFVIDQSLTNDQITKIAKYYGFTLP